MPELMPDAQREPTPGLRLFSPSGLALGLDPGERTGLALYLPEGRRLLATVSVRPLDALDLLAALAEDAGTAVRRMIGDGHRLPDWTVRHAEAGHSQGLGALGFVVIEDARVLPLYHRNRNADRGTRDRIARSVGQVDARTAMLADRARALGLPLYLAAPQRRQKWDDAYFRRVTGYDLPTNEHARDAARLVFGHTPAQLRALCTSVYKTNPSAAQWPT